MTLSPLPSPLRRHRLASALLLCSLLLCPPVLAQEPATLSIEEELSGLRELATSGQRSQALEGYQRLLQRSPDNSDVLLARGRTLAWEGRYPEAEQDLLRVVQRSPDYADAWSALGDLYRWSDRPEQAVQAYARWVELAPEDPEAWLARGRVQRAAGREEAAMADFQAAAARGADISALQPPSVATLLSANPEASAVQGYRWGVRAGIDWTGFNNGRAAWRDADVGIRRYFTRGSLGLEVLHADHFDTTDRAIALDAYAPLWERAYTNLRYQHGPSSGILPQRAWRMEVFQGVGSGWELSASVDQLRFSDSIEFYGIGVGRYVGNWYGRYKLQHVPGVGSGSWSHRLQLRHYYRGNADDYWQASVSSGRSTDVDRFGTVVRDSNAALGLSWTRYPHPQWGFRLGIGYADDADGVIEQRASAALYHRW